MDNINAKSSQVNPASPAPTAATPIDPAIFAEDVTGAGNLSAAQLVGMQKPAAQCLAEEEAMRQGPQRQPTELGDAFCLSENDVMELADPENMAKFARTWVQEIQPRFHVDRNGARFGLTLQDALGLAATDKNDDKPRDVLARLYGAPKQFHGNAASQSVLIDRGVVDQSSGIPGTLYLWAGGGHFWREDDQLSGTDLFAAVQAACTFFGERVLPAALEEIDKFESILRDKLTEDVTAQVLDNGAFFVLTPVSTKGPGRPAKDEDAPNKEGPFAKLKKAISALAKRFVVVRDERYSNHLRKLRLLDAVSLGAGNLGDNGRHWDQLDAIRFHLPCRNGVLDLQHGVLRPGHPADRYLMRVPVDYVPGAPGTLWRRFISDLMLDRQEIVEYLQIILGAALCRMGDNPLFLVFHGAGSNGKSALLKALGNLLGGLFKALPKDVVLAGKSVNAQAANPSLIEMKARALVAFEETRTGDRLDVGEIKSMSAGTPMAARPLYGNIQNFTATATLILATNHKPKIEDFSVGTSRRFRLVPFDARFWDDMKFSENGIDPDTTPPDQWPDNVRRADPGIENALATPEEQQGALAWLVEGARLFVAHGMQLPRDPEVVRTATANWISGEDRLGQFLHACTLRRKDAQVSIADLKQVYRLWAEGEGFKKILAPDTFLKQLYERVDDTGEKIVTQGRTKHGRYCKGLMLSDEGNRLLQPPILTN